MIEAVAILATLVRGARMTHDDTHAIRPVVRVTLRSQGGMPMRVSTRA